MSRDAGRTSGVVAVVAAMGAGAIVSHGLARATLPILLPAMETELLDDRQQSGLLGSSGFVAYLVAVGLATAMSGRVEPLTLLKIGLAVAAVGFTILARAPGFAWLLGGQALAGFGSAGIWMAAPTLATRAAPAHRRGMAMGVLSSSMGVGLLIISQSTNLVRAVTGDDALWRPVWIGAAAFTTLLLVLVTSVIRIPPTTPAPGGISLTRLRSVPGWLPLSLAYWLFGLTSSSFAPFVGLFLSDEGYGASHITNLFALLGLAAALGPVNLGRLSDRVGRRLVLTGCLTAIAVAALLALAAREPFTAVAIGLFGAASFTFPILVVAHLSDHLQDRAMTNALGALTLVFSTALVIGPAAAGAVADSRFGIETVFVIHVGLVLTGAVAITTLPRPERLVDPGSAGAAATRAGAGR